MKSELITKPRLETLKQEKTKKIIDHPLSRATDSTWNRFYDDKRIWEEIEKDVKRTRVELAFFQLAVDPSRNSKDDMARLEMQA